MSGIGPGMDLRVPAAIGAVALLLVVAAPAGAANHGLKYVSKSDDSIVTFGDTPAKAPCRRQGAATAGGVVIDGGTATMVGDDVPFDGKDRDRRRDDGWYGSARNVSNVATYSMTTFGICSRSGRFKVRHSAATQVPQYSQNDATVACPSGTRVVGGGVQTPNETAVGLGTSEPIDTDADGARDDAWTIWVTNEGAGDLLSPFKAYAICATQRLNHYQYVQSSTINIPDGTQVQQSAVCPSGASVVGGGAHLSGTDETIELGATAPRDSLGDANTVPDDGWLAYGNNDSGSTQNITTYAICRS